MIPQCNPLAGYLAHREEFDQAVRRVLSGGRYILGPEVEGFEEEFAEYCSVAHGIGVGSGTDAIELALRSLGVSVGDRVALPAHTAVATAAAVSRCGASPVFVDIDEYYTMSADSLLDLFTTCGDHPPTAVLAVHLYGQMADMDSIISICERFGVPLIEDCAQAHGSRYRGRRAGSIGICGCFSFYPTKNLGALGDGGMVVTDDQALAERLWALRQYGWRRRYVSENIGINSRLDELQAAILRVGLKHLDHDNRARVHLAALYREGLGHQTGMELPALREGAEHVYHQFVVKVPDRDKLINNLSGQGISTAVHYPQPIHLQPAYADPGFRPVTLGMSEKISPAILSLPMFPAMTNKEADRVITCLLA